MNCFKRLRLALVKNHARMRCVSKHIVAFITKVTLKQGDVDWLKSGARWLVDAAES